MKVIVLAILLAASAGPVWCDAWSDAGEQPASSPPGGKPAYRRQQTWYEFALKQLNPGDVDWGVWVEQRRRALLQSTVMNEYFWYSSCMTAALLLMIIAYAKLRHDHGKSLRLAAEQMSAIRNHDAHSRQVAAEAIRKYNEHIERCNRAIEAAESGQWQQTGADPEVANLRIRLDETAAKLETVTREKARLEAELTQKAALLTDLSLRLDALARKSGDSRQNTTPGNSGSASQGELVRHINSLQQELYAEREKNKRLKGA